MKLLLHTCCAPCLEYPYQVLINEEIDFTPYFYNPNIQPGWEYQRRKSTLVKFSEINPCDIIFSDLSQDHEELNTLSFENMWAAFPKDEKCANCYRIRLEKTARFAVEKGYDSFSSTLMGSIYQNHDLICTIGKALEVKYKINFYNHDFRKGFRSGQKQAFEQGLYRQKYCGCAGSLDESALKKKILAAIPSEFAQYR